MASIEINLLPKSNLNQAEVVLKKELVESLNITENKDCLVIHLPDEPDNNISFFENFQEILNIGGKGILASGEKAESKPIHPDSLKNLMKKFPYLWAFSFNNISSQAFIKHKMDSNTETFAYRIIDNGIWQITDSEQLRALKEASETLNLNEKFSLISDSKFKTGHLAINLEKSD